MRLVALFTLFFCLSLHNQLQSQTADPTFPESWQGDWKGTLEIFNGSGKAHSTEMTLEIHKIDTSKEGRYTFGLIYGSKELDWRPYELVPVKPEYGMWKVDEKNSIVMESYLNGPRMLCWFTVDNETRILCMYEKLDENNMLFEVVAGSEKPVSTTGNTKQGDEDIFEVKTFPINAFQRARLKRN